MASSAQLVVCLVVVVFVHAGAEVGRRVSQPELCGVALSAGEGVRAVFAAVVAGQASRVGQVVVEVLLARTHVSSQVQLSVQGVITARALGQLVYTG